MSDVDSINRSFRKGDVLRWRTLEFIVGYEIKISNNPSDECSICKKLAGKYPKSFDWDGWHYKCKCFCVSILMDEETFDKKELSDLKSALNGLEPMKFEAKNEVKYVPECFIDWFLENRKHLNETHSMPEFVTNNIQLIMLSYEHYKR
jgi:hypothetical protein